MWYDNVSLKTDYNYISSRIRFARNFDAFLFPNRLSDREAKKLVDNTLSRLSNIDVDLGFKTKINLFERFSDIERMSMYDRKILNMALANKKTPTGIILSEDEHISIVINGDDHIRLQTISSGINLYDLIKKADVIDDYINERFEYAFNEKYGYLTTYPTNIGTGMRAGVVLHLPASSKSNGFLKLVSSAGRFGVVIKGIHGEGRENFGSLFEVSNPKTLGITEKEIIDTVTGVANQLNSNEMKLRGALLKEKRLEKQDEAYKSYGVLKYARKLSLKDALIYLSSLMMGSADNLIKLKEPYVLYSLMIGCASSNMLKMADRPLTEDEIDEIRAIYIRDNLPKIFQETMF